MLIVFLVVGFASYAVWRLSQAILDRGGMGSDAGGLARRGIQSMHVEEISKRQEQVLSALGWIGFFSLAAVFAIIGWFLVKAAVQFDPHDAVSIGGALGRLARLDYGKFLLGLVAAGLFANGLFGFVQSRYHKA